MDSPGALVGICWLVIIAYWIISAFSAKPNLRRGVAGWSVRFSIVVIILVLFNIPGVGAAISRGVFVFPAAVQWIGVILCALGICLAIWARFYLGTNWGMPVSLKQDAKLVTTGPYEYVRHPIYSGFLLAMFGTMLVTFWWIVPLVLFAVYFVWAAHQEEKIMIEAFPAQYPEYMGHSYALVPYVW